MPAKPAFASPSSTAAYDGAMAHPPRYDDRDPLLARVRELAFALPEAKEKISHGTPTFFTVKVFAQYGAPIKGEHDSMRLRRALVFRPEEGERPALLEDERIHVPGYVGAYGWLALDLTHGDPDWAEVAELMESSYRLTAPARLVTQLDAAS